MICDSCDRDVKTIHVSGDQGLCGGCLVDAEVADLRECLEFIEACLGPPEDFWRYTEPMLRRTIYESIKNAKRSS